MNKRLFYVSLLIISCILVFSQCVRKAPESDSADIRGKAFAGAAACVSCHRQIYDSYINTGHFNTSAPASTKTIKGSFGPHDNSFSYSNGIRVAMESRDSGLFQTAYAESTLQEIHRFDITMGSGRKAQTFLTWSAGKYFQLPLSWFVPANSWANSPGFPPSYPKFDRMIPSTCFGCHSSAVGIKDVHMEGRHLSEEFEKNQLVYGIDCERCHGPAAEHVAFHTSHPKEKNPMHITKVRSLQHQQRLDMCALCHSGLGIPQKPAFDYKPGDALSDYFFPDFTRPTRAAELDVHGKQYQLFTASKCFVKSDDMTCSSCHHPHNSERNQLATFSQRCMSCHQAGQPGFCKLKNVSAEVLSKNCIDCHMPALASGKITLLTNGQTSPTPDSMRTHLITVYPEEAKRVLARFK
jgi:predicted CXXCH cytochrome family protein